MFYGFHAGLAAVEGCRVEHVLEDIQSLNRRALERADLEITAVSAHAYAFLADRYAVLACGASMGHGVGPVVVAREPRTLESLAGRRVAIPGPLTTAALLLRCECPGCVPVEVMFDRIPAAVLAGEVEAGVIIHESQLTYRDEGLVKVLDFGELWQRARRAAGAARARRGAPRPGPGADARGEPRLPRLDPGRARPRGRGHPLRPAVRARARHRPGQDGSCTCT